MSNNYQNDHAAEENFTSSQMSIPMEAVPVMTAEDIAATKRRRSSEGPPVPTYPIFFSQRLVFVLVAFFGFFTTYLMRMCISIAVVAMVNRTEYLPPGTNITEDMLSEIISSNTSGLNFTLLPGECPKEDKIKINRRGEFPHWDKQIQGHILGAFYIGYTLGQIPTGWLAQTYGGKIVITVCYLVSGIVTLLLPVAARGHYIILILLRVATGCCQACTFPSMQNIYARWLPPNERSGLIGFAYSGNQIGGVAAIFLSGLLCQYVSWDSVFYVWGGLCVGWSVVWFFLVYDTPQVHPRITAAERQYIEFCLKDQAATKKTPMLQLPWLKFATSLPLWAIFITHLLCSYGNSVFYTCIPLYMQDMLNVDMKSNGLLSSFPFIGMAIMTVVGGQAADFMRRKNILNTEWIRKVLTILGSLLPMVFEIVMVHLACGDKPGTVSLLVLSVAFTGFTFGGGYIVNIQDIAPAYSSLLFGLANTLGAIPGFVAPMVVGKLTPNRTRGEWRVVFYICGALYIVAAAFFVFAAKGVVQPWAKEKEEDHPPASAPGQRREKDVETSAPLLAGSPGSGATH